MLVSLIIPTRERSQFLQESLKTAIAVEGTDVDIVVSDNASLDNTREVVERCQDPRLKYVNTGHRVSMRQNFEFALEQSSGEYVIYIGDDDGFLPRQLQWLRQILERDRPEVFSWEPLRYGWSIAGFGKRPGGVRFQRMQIYGVPQQVDLNRRATLLRNAQMLDLDCMPAVYHGCVSREYLASIKRRVGASIAGRIPDVYIAYYATLANASCLYSAHPFTINGYSPASTGNASHAYRSSDKRIKPAVRFGNEAATDPRQDVVAGFAPTIPLNLFSTYETVCDHLGVGVDSASREAWYRYVLSGTDKSDIDIYQSVVASLDAYANKTGTESELRNAAVNSRLGPGKRNSKVRSVLRKLWSRAQSVKYSAARDGNNTVFTAAQLADDLLASDYETALARGHSSLKLWTRFLARGLFRPRTQTPLERPGESDSRENSSSDEAAKAA
jgi:glycosyltransferase involved in cell wall biosynthesis